MMTVEERLIRIESILERLTRLIQVVAETPATSPQARLVQLAAIDPEGSKDAARALFKSTGKRRAA